MISAGRTVGWGVAVGSGVWVGETSVAVGSGVAVGGSCVAVAGISVGVFCRVGGTVADGRAEGALVPQLLIRAVESKIRKDRINFWRVDNMFLGYFSFYRILLDIGDGAIRNAINL
jgi:hypothetical protein